MARQLALLDPQPEWQIDDDTRAVGRAGLARARAALAAAHRDEVAPAERPTRGRRALTSRDRDHRTAA
jgi:hypothetical protein